MIVGFAIATPKTLLPGRRYCCRWWPGGRRGLVISDAHGGIKAAKGNWPMVAALVRSMFE